MAHLSKLKLCSSCNQKNAIWFRVSLSNRGLIKKHYSKLSKCEDCYQTPDESKIASDIQLGFVWVKLDEWYIIHFE